MAFMVLTLLSGSFAQSRKTLKPITGTAERAEWFKDARFGMFVHWGLYSILAGHYKGHQLPDTTYKYGNSWYAEWINSDWRFQRRNTNSWQLNLIPYISMQINGFWKQKMRE